MCVGIFPSGTRSRHVAEVSVGAQITPGFAPPEDPLLKLPHVLRAVELPVREVCGILCAPVTLHAGFARGRRNDAPVLSRGLFAIDTQSRGQSVSRRYGAAR